MQPEIEIFSALVTALLIKPSTLLQPLSNLREQSKQDLFVPLYKMEKILTSKNAAGHSIKKP